MEEMETTLRNLPRPSSKHLDILDQLLVKIEEEHGLSDKDLSIRKVVTSKIDDLLSSNIPGCSVKLYGSSLTGFGLKEADLNLDLNFDHDKMEAHKVLIAAFDILKSQKDLE